MTQDDDNPPPPGLLDVFKSVGAAFIGIQSDANRRRDFSQGKLHHYVIAGAIATIAFVVILYGIVRLALAILTSP